MTCFIFNYCRIINNKMSKNEMESYVRIVGRVLKNFLSDYDQSNWVFYVGYYLEVSASLLYVQERVH